MSKILNILSQTLTAILYPLFIPTYGMIMFVLTPYCGYTTMPPTVKWVIIGGTFVLTCFIPLSIVLIMLLQKRITDLNMTDSKERTIPYLYTITSFGFWCYFLAKICHMPKVMVVVTIASTVAIGIVMIINLWWKISAHLTGFGCFIGSIVAISAFYGHFSIILVGILLFIAFLLMCSRLYLNAHSPLQVVTGFIWGLLITLLTGIIF